MEQSLAFLIESASTLVPTCFGVDIRPLAYTSIGQLVLAMTDEETGQVIGGSDMPAIKISDDPTGTGGHIVEFQPCGVIYEQSADIFALVKTGLQATSGANGGAGYIRESDFSDTLCPALHCATSLIAALGDLAKPYIPELIDEMFQAGLSNDLIKCCQSIAHCVPDQQDVIEDRMLQEVSICLAGIRDGYDPLSTSLVAGWQRNLCSYSIDGGFLEGRASSPEIRI